MQRVLFIVFKILETFSAKAASYFIDYKMRSPRKFERRAKEKPYIDTAIQQNFQYRHFTIQEYRWGKTEHPIALCIHGWEGNAGNFGKFSELFTQLGYQLVAIDGPAHGTSSTGKVHMFEYVDFVTAQVERLHPKIIISHSFGSVCTVFSMIRLKNFQLDRWIAITTPNAFRDYLDHMLQAFNVKETTVVDLIGRIQKRVEIPFEELDMEHTRQYVKSFPKTAIFHSKEDLVIPFWQAQKAAEALPHADFFPMEKVGHYKILWDKRLHRELEAWMKS